MKKIITILMGVVISMTAMGQIAREHQKFERYNKQTDTETFKSSRLNKRHSAQVVKARQMDMSRSAEAIKHRLDKSILEKWDKNTNQWLEEMKYEFTYNENGKATVILFSEWDEGNTAWEKVWKAEEFYDGNGNNVMGIWYEWNESTSQWVNGSKYEFMYNANDHLITEIWYDPGEGDNQWVVERKFEYSYDISGNKTLTVLYLWEESTNQWVNGYKEEFIYDANGNMILELWHHWNQIDGNYELSNKEEYTFDSGGHIIMALRSRWLGYTNEWEHAWGKDEFVIDINGNPISEVFYNWDEDTNQWNSIEKSDRTYDLTYGLSDLIIPSLDFFIYERYEPIKNMPTVFTSYYYEDNTWNNSYKETFYFTQVDFLAISQIAKSDINVFPNPASEFMVFDMGDISTSATVEIFDIQGRKVLSQLLTENKQVSVRHLAKGLYVYSLIDNGKLHNGKIVVE